jgi:hypothetical protein
MDGLRKCGVYIHNRVLLSYNENEMLFVGKWMEFENIMLSEVSQVQKGKGCIFSLIYGR